MSVPVPSLNVLPVPTGPLGAALRAAFAGLGVDALCLVTAASEEAPVQITGACGAWPDHQLDIADLARATVMTARPLDGRAIGAGFAAGIRLDVAGREPFALLALATASDPRTAEWAERFTEMAQLVAAVLKSRAAGHAGLLHDVAAHPGTFKERLHVALERAAPLLGLDGAVLARVEDGMWIPEAVVDPSGGLIPQEPQAVASMLASLTVRADGPIGVPDVAASGARVGAPAAYLATPVFVSGKCHGVLSLWGHRAHPGFTAQDRDLIEALGRWVGNALTGMTASRELADREAALTSFFDSAPMGMGTIELMVTEGGADDIRCITANSAASLALGVNPEAEGVVSQTALSERALRLWTGACRRALAGSGRSRFDFESAEGHRIIAVTLACIENEAAEAPQFSFVAEDVTRQRKTLETLRDREDQLKAIFDHLPVALHTLDPDGVYIQVEPMSEAAWIGRSVFERFADDEEACLAIRSALAGRRESWTHHVGEQTVLHHAVPLVGVDGQPEGALVVAFDGTAAMAALSSIHEDREAAATRVRNSLLSGLNREIRAPLTTILGYAEMLEPGITPDDLAESSAVIRRSGSRLLQTLDDFVALALLEADEVQPVATPADAASMVDAVVEEHRTFAQRRGITLATRVKVGTDPLLLDSTLFRRVVNHLVKHAVESTAGGRVDVELAVDASEDVLMLSVSDTSGGLGDAAETVFNPFDSEGGVGLAVAQRTVNVLGGTLDVDDRYGEGTTFTVRLPRRPVVLVDLGEAPPRAPARSEARAEVRTSGWV
ncbi:MAG: GAF domain-containing sensor histidine kinase [Bacteroidota bacterium]